MSKKKSLSARQLFEQVYNSIQKKLGGKEIKFSPEVQVKVGSDSDGHRERIGYFCYKKTMLVKIGDKKWVVALGIPSGGYPADPFDCEIAAVAVLPTKLGRKKMEEIEESLEMGIYFRNSMIIASYTGNFQFNPKSQFCEKVLDFLRQETEKLIAKEAILDNTRFTLDTRPVLKSAVEYKPEGIDFLSDNFCKILES